MARATETTIKAVAQGAERATAAALKLNLNTAIL
jgi:hypothetical protein